MATVQGGHTDLITVAGAEGLVRLPACAYTGGVLASTDPSESSLTDRGTSNHRDNSEQKNC